MPDPRRTLLIALIELATGITVAAIYTATPDDMRRARLWSWRTAHRAAGAAARAYGRDGIAAEVRGAPARAAWSYRFAHRFAALSLAAESRYRRALGR